MRRAVLFLAVMMPFSGAVVAGDTSWVAQMEEDEGGPVLVASVTAAAVGDLTPELRLMCAGTEGVNLRYLTSTGTASSGSEADFQFENEAAKLTRRMRLEEMDGAFATYVQPSDPMIGLLQTGNEVTIAEASGNYPAQTFTLKGSSKAIAKLLKTCE